MIKAEAGVMRQSLTTAEPWLTTEQVGELFGKPPGWFHNNAGTLSIPRIKVGRHYRYRASTVTEWFSSGGGT